MSEYGDIKNFSFSNKMLAFAGLESSVIEPDTLHNNGKRVKNGFDHLRYSPTFYYYYLKKSSEGSSNRVALSHVCKKPIRVIYTLEKNNIDFDPSLLK